MSLPHSNTSTINMKHFIKTFFLGVNCEVLEKNDVIHVRLTKAVDKAIMNRPFYWQYNESIGQKGQPATLKFSLNENEEIGEVLYIGSARFQQLYRYLQTIGKFTKMYEQIESNQNTMLHPWLLINAVLTYDGKQTKEELYSIGLNLISGKIISEFMETLQYKSLHHSISDHCYTISPIISLPSGFKRIEETIFEKIMNLQHVWAIDSYETLQQELSLINSLAKIKEFHPVIENEKELAINKFQPKINMEVLSSGIIYLVTEN